MPAMPTLDKPGTLLSRHNLPCPYREQPELTLPDPACHDLDIPFLVPPCSALPAPTILNTLSRTIRGLPRQS